MNRIVILTDQSGPNEKLIEWLNLIFPECEIEIQPDQVQAKNAPSSRTKKKKSDMLDEKIDELMSFL